MKGGCFIYDVVRGERYPLFTPSVHVSSKMLCIFRHLYIRILWKNLYRAMNGLTELGGFFQRPGAIPAPMCYTCYV